MSFIQDREQQFNQLSENLLNHLEADESLTISLRAESTDFVRVNQAKVRQTMNIEQGQIGIQLIKEQKQLSFYFEFTGNPERDLKEGLTQLQSARTEIKGLPEDPFVILPKNNGSSHEHFKGDLPASEQLLNELLEPAKDYDLVGIYAGGPVISANINSEGQKHWFATESFSFDFSLYSPEQNAVKELYAGSSWESDSYTQKLKLAASNLEMMNRPARKIKPGKYRTYMAPAAVQDLLGILNWDGISYNSYRQGQSALEKLQNGTSTLSPLFTLEENFELGLSPRFDNRGELSPQRIPLIEEGQLKNLLISSRSAKEYSVESNGANHSERFQSPIIASGHLDQDNILSTLGEGLYLSNLHYLNWSDRSSGRITGMTRYACFWVENGEIVAPIENLRFDESLYRFFGENLEAVTNFQETSIATDSYERRGLGGSRTPGMLFKEFEFTL